MQLGSIIGLFKKADGDAADGSDKRIRLALILGAAAVLLILLSDSLSCGCNRQTSAQSGELSSQEYAQYLEDKLGATISRIDGAGETVVMITLDSGVENIYASEEQSRMDESQSSEPDGRTGRDASSDSQSSYIIIDGENGEEPLVRTQLMPRISGVVVLCAGADDPEVAARVKEIVTTALGVSSRRVCVARLTG